LFPNPASNYFTLNINTTKVQVFRWQAGSKSFDASHSKVLLVINDLSKGLYIVKALNENDEVQMMKLKKNNVWFVCEKAVPQRQLFL
jgi:cAMP phosphodiesterase